jgi:Calx-beta domain/FG-GAP-like repeat
MLAVCALAPVSVLGQCAVPTFRAAADFDAGDRPPDIASGDLNSDGRTDLVVTNRAADEIIIFMGNSNGLPTRTKLTSPDEPTNAGIGDFNRDGKMDLAIMHGEFSTAGVSIFIGDGSGGFGPPTNFPIIRWDHLVVADFNNDGNADVFVSTADAGPSQILLGNGSGGLSGGSNVSVGFGRRVVPGDFNKDNKLDLALAGEGASVSVILGDGLGNFSAPKKFPVSNGAGFIATADFNNDGNVDLVTAGNGISVLAGDGAGNFGAATIVSLGFPTATVTVADFNGDSKPDVAVSGDQSLIAILIGNGNGGFGTPVLYRINTSALDIVSGDFDGDNKADVAITNTSFSPLTSMSLFYGDGSGNLRFASVIPVGSSPYAITNGDLNSDGHDDLVYANISHDTVSVLINNGSGGFGPPATFAVGAEPRSVALGDLNGDQKLDLVTANSDAFSVSVLLGNGQGAFGPANHISVPGFNPESVTIGDLNNDGRPDIAVAYRSASIVSILLANSSGGFGSPASFPVPSGGGQDIVINDLNRDGLPDLLVTTGGGVSVLLGNSSTGFGPTNTLASAGTAVVVDDFNGDGKSDIASLVFNPGLVKVFLGDGQGGFSQPTPFPAGFTASFLRSADFNGDGNADLVVLNHLSTASILLGNGSGDFEAPVTYEGGTGIVTREITTGDFNSDNHPDFALTDQSGNVSVVFNSCSATPVSLPTLSIGSVTVNEGEAGTVDATFNVSLSAASSKTVVVSFSTAGRDAAKDVDYQTRLGALTFAPGVTAQTVTVPVMGDALDEFDEQFDVRLVYPVNAVVSGGPAQGTILDNDLPPSISINDVTVNEGHVGTTSAVFTVSLSGPSGKPIGIVVHTADGTAQAGIDYQQLDLGLFFNVGQTSVTATVAVIGDNLNEPNKNFFINLTTPVNATVADGQGAGTIVDDDPLHLILDESGPAADQAAALDSILMLRDPFQLQSVANWPSMGADRRTRVIVFASSLELFQGQPPSIVVVSLVDSNNQTHEVSAEDVRVVPNFPFTQVVFPLPATLSPGVCKVTIKAHGQISNTGTIRIAAP